MSAERAAEKVVLTRAQLELERTITKWCRRWPPGSACEVCGVTNPLCLVCIDHEILCYADKVCRTFEEHSLIGAHQPPRVLIDPNHHRILSEAQRIRNKIMERGCRAVFVAELSSWITVQLASLGSLQVGP